MAQVAINKANKGDFSEIINIQDALLNPFLKQVDIITKRYRICITFFDI